MHTEPSAAVKRTLQGQLLRSLLLVVVLVGIGTLSVVSYWSARGSESSLATISGHIEAQLESKGRGLAESHALALKGMILDNAFSDMEGLVARTVDDDTDVLYGILVDTDGHKLAFAARGTPLRDANAKSPWVAIGLAKVLSKVSSTEVRRIHANTGEVLEAATPVRGADREVLATLRYGISTRTMREALDVARARARRELSLALASLVGLVAVVGAAGVVLGRREARRIVKPLTALTEAARSIASGNREVRVGIRSGDELELLGNTFDQMAEELATSYRALEELNKGLEQQVAKRTAQLANRTRDMRVVLDNVTQGLVTIDAQGVMAAERSAVVEKWFGAVPEGARLPAYLEPRAKVFAAQLRAGLMQLEDGILPKEVGLAQLPTRLVTVDREYRIAYEAIGDDDPVRAVLVMIEDVTEAVKRQREEHAQREVLRAVQHLTRDRGGFLAFLRDGETLLREVAMGSDLPTVRRALHTLKGNSSLFGLQVLAGLCHEMEGSMADSGALPPPAAIEALARRYSDLVDSLEPFMGGAQRELIEVPRAELEALLGRMRAGPDGVAELKRVVTSWTLEPVAKPLERLSELAKALAGRLGRGEVTCTIEFDNTRLDSGMWAPFWSAMSHVVRNAVDHGLEFPDERATQGKALGRISFRAATKAGETTIAISDDGRGIDWEALRREAEAAGLPARTRDDLVAAMLTDGITTRGVQTEISGRGVGMSAVRKVVQRLGGRILVETSAGAGTTWLFKMPTQIPIVTGAGIEPHP